MGEKKKMEWNGIRLLLNFASNSPSVLTPFSFEPISSATRFYGDCCDPQHQKTEGNAIPSLEERVLLPSAAAHTVASSFQSHREDRAYTHLH